MNKDGLHAASRQKYLKSGQVEAKIEQFTQEQLRIKHGLQCPECFGVNITNFQCQDCGCQWGK